MPKHMYDWYGSECKGARGLTFPQDRFYSGTQLWVKISERNTSEKCQCGIKGCVYVEVKYKKG